MNETISKLLLVGDKFISKIHLRQPDLLTVLVDYLLQKKKEYKIGKKQEIHDVFIETK